MYCIALAYNRGTTQRCGKDHHARFLPSFSSHSFFFFPEFLFSANRRTTIYHNTAAKTSLLSLSTYIFLPFSLFPSFVLFARDQSSHFRESRIHWVALAAFDVRQRSWDFVGFIIRDVMKVVKKQRTAFDSSVARWFRHWFIITKQGFSSVFFLLQSWNWKWMNHYSRSKRIRLLQFMQQ